MTELEVMKRAKMYIDKLANGIDPLTDNSVADDSVLNQVRISKCLTYVSGVLSKVIDNDGEVTKVTTSARHIPFYITDEQRSNIEISDEAVGIAVIASRIAAVLDMNVKTVPAGSIGIWLTRNGYLQEYISNGKKIKISTAKGESIGIHAIEYLSSKGITYTKNIYDQRAQKFIIDNIVKINDDLNNIED